MLMEGEMIFEEKKKGTIHGESGHVDEKSKRKRKTLM
jgi:hypothetical protein